MHLSFFFQFCINVSFLQTSINDMGLSLLFPSFQYLTQRTFCLCFNHQVLLFIQCQKTPFKIQTEIIIIIIKHRKKVKKLKFPNPETSTWHIHDFVCLCDREKCLQYTVYSINVQSIQQMWAHDHRVQVWCGNTTMHNTLVHVCLSAYVCV